MSDRRALYVQLQMVCAGHDVATCIGALCDSLASTIGFASDSQGRAHKLVGDLAPGICRTIDDNWEELRRIRSIAHGNIPDGGRPS